MQELIASEVSQFYQNDNQNLRNSCGGIMKHRINLLVALSILVVLVFLFGISSCDKDKPTNVTEQTGTVAGTVSSSAKTFLPGVTVSIGNKTTVTDSNGNFSINGIAVGANVMVNFEKVDYVHTQKVVTVQNGRTTYTSCTLFPASYTTFSASMAQSIYDSGALIDLPANAFETPSGVAFTGTVLAELKYFDPSNADCLNAFPGNFSGVQTDGTEVMFESFGFISASFYDASYTTTELQLSSGKTAQITYQIPPSLLSNAPATIPMWYYNETTGKWMEEGSANLVGNHYVGSVSHFSYWNFDHPIQISDQSTLTGKVVMDDANNTPVPNAQVVANGLNYSGYTRAFSDASGIFELTVKASSQVQVQAFQGVNSCNPTGVIATPAGGGTADIGELEMNNYSFTITGNLVNSAMSPYANANGMIYDPNPTTNEELHAWVYTDSAGSFSVQASNTSTGSQTNALVRLYYDNAYVFSSQFTLTIPQPGEVVNLGTVIMHPAAHLTGRAKDNNGTWLVNQGITFNKNGLFTEGAMMPTVTDALGYFDLEGPANVVITDMIGTAWLQSVDYVTPMMNLGFPSSGQTSDLGVITLSPAPGKKKK